MSFSLLGLALVLPFLTTPILIWRGNRRFWHVVHIVVWGLAVIAALFLGVSIASPLWALVLWGNWLYGGVAVGALLAELAMFIKIRDPRSSAIP